MDLVDLEATRSGAVAAKAREASEEEGGDVALVLQLPDGQQHTHTFKLGATVAYVKLVIQEAHGLPMERVTLTPATGGRPFIDPLSLADCPSIAAAATDGQCLVLVSERESSE